MKVGAFNNIYNEEYKCAANVYCLLDDILFISLSSPTLKQEVDY